MKTNTAFNEGNGRSEIYQILSVNNPPEEIRMLQRSGILIPNIKMLRMVNTNYIASYREYNIFTIQNVSLNKQV